MSKKEKVERSHSVGELDERRHNVLFFSCLITAFFLILIAILASVLIPLIIRVPFRHNLYVSMNREIMQNTEKYEYDYTSLTIHYEDDVDVVFSSSNGNSCIGVAPNYSFIYGDTSDIDSKVTITITNNSIQIEDLPEFTVTLCDSMGENIVSLNQNDLPSPTRLNSHSYKITIERDEDIYISSFVARYTYTQRIKEVA